MTDDLTLHPTRCVCGHVQGHHVQGVPSFCEWRGCGCPRFIAALTDEDVDGGSVWKHIQPTGETDGTRQPNRCPTCGSEDPDYHQTFGPTPDDPRQSYGMTGTCPDPWHTGETDG